MKILLILTIPFFLFATPFKVATYNVENLFDAVHDGTEYEEYIPGRHNWDERTAEIKLNHTAEVICDLDADLVGLQEVENSRVFEHLQKRLKKVGCGYRYAAITQKRGAPIQVALLSRFPIKRKRELQVNYSPRVRNILEVEVEIEGNSLLLFVNHWKSKSRRGVESKRVAAAKRLQKRISLLPYNQEYLILGDLNSNYNADLTLKKRLDDTSGIRGINHILKTTLNQKPVEKVQIGKAGKGVHYNPWLELPFKERWSHKFYGHKSTLDHILLPSVMFDGKGVDYVNHSFKVFKPGYLFTPKGYIAHWEYKHGKHTGRGYSDHLPVYALFDTIPYRPSAEKKKETIQGNIEYFYTSDTLSQPVKLENAVVLLKRGRYAVVKQTPKGRGIFLFGCVNGLKEGYSYDLLVEDISVYKGLKEITELIVLKERGKTDLKEYYATLATERQNEVLRGLTGIYRNRKFYVDGRKIPIFFKNRNITPPNGSKLKIDYAHLGYYKKLQLVIYRKKDFEIMEK